RGSVGADPVMDYVTASERFAAERRIRTRDQDRRDRSFGHLAVCGIEDAEMRVLLHPRFGLLLPGRFDEAAEEVAVRILRGHGEKLFEPVGIGHHVVVGENDKLALEYPEAGLHRPRLARGVLGYDLQRQPPGVGLEYLGRAVIAVVVDGNE